MRRLPAPLRVTRPPPSITTRALALWTFAVAARVMVTGAGPQLNVMTPPAATARTTASEVQLAGVPVPTTRSGWRVSTGCASAGTAACPSGLPAGFAATGGADAEADAGSIPARPSGADGCADPGAADAAADGGAAAP